MAARATGASACFFRSASAPNYNGTYSVVFQATIVTIPANDHRNLFTLSGSSGTGHQNIDCIWLQDTAGAISVGLRIKIGNVIIVDTLSATVTNLTLGTAYYWALTRTGNTLSVYVGATPSTMALAHQVTNSIATRSQAVVSIIFGDVVTTGNNEPTDAAWTGARCVESLWTLDEIKAEAATLFTTTACWGDWPLILASDLTDRSGNSRALTGVGTLGTRQQPSTHLNNIWLPSSGAPPVSLAFDAGWQDTEDADRIRGYRTKGSTALTNKTCDEAVVTNPIDVLNRQYAIGPFTKAGTWTGSVYATVRCQESNAASNSQPQFVLRIVAPDGTVRGTLVTYQTGTSNEFATSLTARHFPKGAAAGLAVTPTAFSIGDYLIPEFGMRNVEGTTTDRIGTQPFGEDGAADLDGSETDTGADNPWMLFSFPLGDALDPVPAGFPFPRSDRRIAALI